MLKNIKIKKRTEIRRGCANEAYTTLSRPRYFLQQGKQSKLRQRSATNTQNVSNNVLSQISI